VVGDVEEPVLHARLREPNRPSETRARKAERPRARDSREVRGHGGSGEVTLRTEAAAARRSEDARSTTGRSTLPAIADLCRLRLS
jgi:hypothetical protein